MSDTLITCNRGCGETQLVWKVINGKYKLFSWEDQLVHICNDGEIAKKSLRQKVTYKLLDQLGARELKEIPDATVYNETATKTQTDIPVNNINPSKCFTINTTASGIALTGDDKHNAIYLPKVAIPELIKALVDFI